MADAKPLVTGIAIVAGTIAAGIISKKVADSLAGDPTNHESEMYDDIHRRLDQSQFYIPKSEESSDGQPRRMMKEENEPDVMDYIHSAISELKAAKKSTHCGVCIKGIDAAVKAVEENSQVVVRADTKYNVLQELKEKGKIPMDATWATISPKQKRFVNRYVEKVIQNGS